MASYNLQISRTAEKQLKKISREHQLRLLRAIQALQVEPRPNGCRKLEGYDTLFRIRVGIYRVIYEVNDGRIVIVVLKVGHRKDVYRT